MKKELKEFLKNTTVENLMKIPEKLKLWVSHEKLKKFRLDNKIPYCYISETGELFAKQPHNFTGKWLQWYTNGQLYCSQYWENGKLHGKCLGWDENGKLKYEINFQNGERYGKCIEWDENEELGMFEDLGMFEEEGREKEWIDDVIETIETKHAKLEELVKNHQKFLQDICPTYEH